MYFLAIYIIYYNNKGYQRGDREPARGEDLEGGDHKQPTEPRHQGHQAPRHVEKVSVQCTPGHKVLQAPRPVEKVSVQCRVYTWSSRTPGSPPC